MRACIVAPPGRTFIVADYAAIEVRVLAHITGDKRLKAIFQAGRDPHRELASILLRKTLADVTKEERGRAKPVNFGFVGAPGMGAQRFVAYARTDYNVIFTEAEAQRFRSSYLATYRQVDEWQRKTRARMDREARTAAGRVRDFANSRDGYTERLNSADQGTAADGMKRAMAVLAPRLAKFDARIVLVVHDEVVAEAPEAAADEIKAVVEAAMRSRRACPSTCPAYPSSSRPRCDARGRASDDARVVVRAGSLGASAIDRRLLPVVPIVNRRQPKNVPRSTEVVEGAHGGADEVAELCARVREFLADRMLVAGPGPAMSSPQPASASKRRQPQFKLYNESKCRCRRHGSRTFGPN